MRKFPVFAAMLSLSLTACGGGGGGTSAPLNPPSAGNHITITFTGASQPTAVAESIGAGAWTAATLSAGNLTFTLPTGTTSYAIAYRCPVFSGMGFVDAEYVIEATIADGASYSLSCFSNPTTATASGNADATAFAATANVFVVGNREYSTTVAGASGAYSASMLPGVNDVAAIAKDASKNLLGVKIVRGQTVPGTIAPITLAASDAVTTAPITIANISSGFNPTPECSVAYNTANGTYFFTNNNSTTQYAVVPAAEAAAGDYYSFESNDANLSTHELLGTTTYTTNPGGPFTITLPNPWTYSGPSAAVFPTFSFVYSGFAGMASIVNDAQIAWMENPTTVADVNVYATSTYLGSSTSVTIPNLTGLAGFLASAPSGTTINWGAQITGGTYPIYVAANPTPGTGKTAYVQLSGSYTQP